jgi:hypothetical protein
MPVNFRIYLFQLHTLISIAVLRFVKTRREILVPTFGNYASSPSSALCNLMCRVVLHETLRKNVLPSSLGS